MARRERGIALVLFLALLVTVGLYVFVTGLREASANSLALSQDELNARVLRQAKEALIGYSLVGIPTHGPGHLPCPDLDNDGDSEGAACGLANTRIGRLPWKTLGLPDLRDASGERLWYVVSANFLPRTTPLPPVNSQTQGQLTIQGTAPANNVVAIILAPGAVLAGQDRTGPLPPSTCTGAPNCSPVNYLEGENGDASNDLYDAVASSSVFNDTVLAIRADELMPMVVNAAAHRVRTEQVQSNSLRFGLTSYYGKWASAGLPFLPFAGDFSVPPAVQNSGTAGIRVGLFPSNTADTFLAWVTTPSPTPVAVAGSVNSASCAADPGPPAKPQNLICTYTFNNLSSPTVSVSAAVANGALTFFEPINPLTDYKACTGAGCTNFGTATLNSQSISFSVGASGAIDVTMQYRLPARFNSATVPTRVSVTLRSSTDMAATWYSLNEWPVASFYAVSSTHVAGGSQYCSPPPTPVPLPSPCSISIVGAGIPAASPTRPQVAILFPGGALPNQTQPSNVRTNYLEGVYNPDPTNWAAANNTFENLVRTPTGNDKIGWIWF